MTAVQLGGTLEVLDETNVAFADIVNDWQDELSGKMTGQDPVMSFCALQDITWETIGREILPARLAIWETTLAALNAAPANPDRYNRDYRSWSLLANIQDEGDTETELLIDASANAYSPFDYVPDREVFETANLVLNGALKARRLPESQKQTLLGVNSKGIGPFRKFPSDSLRLAVSAARNRNVSSLQFEVREVPSEGIKPGETIADFIIYKPDPEDRPDFLEHFMARKILRGRGVYNPYYSTLSLAEQRVLMPDDEAPPSRLYPNFNHWEFLVKFLPVLDSALPTRIF